MSDNEKLVVIGGDAAGMSCASQAKRKGENIDVTVFEKGQYVSYGACGIPYYVEGYIKNVDNLVHMSPDKFRERRNLDVRIGHEVTEIKPDEKKVVVETDSEEFEEEYNKLMISTGAKPIKPPFEGVELDGVHTVGELPDGKKIKDEINNDSVENVGVVGGGYIGIEMTEAFAENDLNVKMFEMKPRVFPTLEPEMSEMVQDKLIDKGVEVHTNTALKSLKGDGKVETLITEAGEEFDVDLVVLALGIQPNSELAKEAGIETGIQDSIVTDEYMRTNKEDIYAAGDCAQTKHIVTEEPTYIPLALTANKMGMLAGKHIAGIEDPFKGVAGTSITRAFNIEVGRTGLSKKEAEEKGYDVVKSTIKARSKAGYCPGSKIIKISYIMEEGTGKMLGAQIVGEEVGKRIDVVATALNSGYTVHDMLDLDLSYAPPFDPVWDPVLKAARVASKKV